MGDANAEIPLVQRAALLAEAAGDLSLKTDYPVSQPSQLLPGQCLVNIKYSGVCHSDLSIRHDHYAFKCKPNLVGGHEGIGNIVAIAEGSRTTLKVGDRVGISFMAQSCLDCEMCRKGHDARKWLYFGLTCLRTQADWFRMRQHEVQWLFHRWNLPRIRRV